MMRKLVVLSVGLGLIGCGEGNRKPAIAPSGSAATPAAPPGRQRPASDSVSPEQIQELIAKLEKGEAKATDLFLQGLSGAAINGAVPGLIAALKNKDPSVRREAIKVLYRYVVECAHERRAVMTALASAESALIAALEDDDAGVRMEAVDALRTAPGTKDRASLYMDPLKDSDHFVRMRAAAALGQIGPAAKDAVPALAAAMTDENEIVRGAATAALAKVGLPAVPALAKALSHQRTDVARQAASALAEIGAPAQEAIIALQESSKARDAALAAFSLWALTMIDRKTHPPQDAVRALMEIMSRTGENELRGSAAYALGRIGPEARPAVPLLIEAIKDRDFAVHDPAFVALGKLGADAKDAVPALIHAMHDDYPRNLIPNHRAVETLGNIGPAAQAATPELVKIFQGNVPDHRKVLRSDGTVGADPMMRQVAAEALGKTGPADVVVPILIDALKDDNLRVRTYAARGLKALGPAGKAAVPALAEALREGHKGNVNVNYEAAKALAAMGPEGIDALIEAAKDPDHDRYAPAIEALAALGPKAKAAVPVLTEALGDRYRRQWAAPALKKIDPDTAAKLGLEY